MHVGNDTLNVGLVSLTFDLLILKWHQQVRVCIGNL